MALETAMTTLSQTLDQFERTLDDLLWAVVQGQPQDGPGHTLIDHYDAATSDLLGLVKDARAAVAAGHAATQDQPDLYSVRRALSACQDCFNRLVSRFYGELLAFEWLTGLDNLARERGGEWAYWVQGVQDALSPCPPALHELGQALTPCWCDLTERAGLLAVSAHATNTGAQIYLGREPSAGPPPAA